MKKLFLLLIALLAPAASLCACAKNVDYYSYVSEYRRDVYLYEEDDVSFKLYCTERETPYQNDGIKGETTPLVEVYFTSDKTPDEVLFETGEHRGEMNYLAVTRNFYLSFTADDVVGTAIPIKLTVDGEELSFEAYNVREEGTIDGATALRCVTEYDGERFSSLTQGRNFLGEIGVRLLYDEGCYYYVGVCDREGNIHAYLLDASDGRIIAERDSKG